MKKGDEINEDDQLPVLPHLSLNLTFVKHPFNGLKFQDKWHRLHWWGAKLL